MRMFGADGARGLANELLTPGFVVQLGQAAARVLTKDIPALQLSCAGRPHAVVRRDTRASGKLLDYAISVGLASSDVDATHVGVLPTPMITHFTATQSTDLDAVISVSHSPFQDNGIKFFGRRDYEPDGALEDQIEILLDKVG